MGINENGTPNDRHENGHSKEEWLPRNWRQMAITLIWMLIVVLIAHCSGLGPLIMPQIPAPQWNEPPKHKKDRHERKDALDRAEAGLDLPGGPEGLDGPILRVSGSVTPTPPLRDGKTARGTGNPLLVRMPCVHLLRNYATTFATIT